MAFLKDVHIREHANGWMNEALTTDWLSVYGHDIHMVWTKSKFRDGAQLITVSSNVFHPDSSKEREL